MRIWLSVFLTFSPEPSSPIRSRSGRSIHSAAATLAGALERSALVRSLVAELMRRRRSFTSKCPSPCRPASARRRASLSVPAITPTCASRSRRCCAPTNARFCSATSCNTRWISPDPALTNQADVKRLLETTGYRTGSNLFETRSALRTERRIRAEFRQGAFRRGGASSEPEPVIEFHHQHLRAGAPKPLRRSRNAENSPRPRAVAVGDVPDQVERAAAAVLPPEHDVAAQRLVVEVRVFEIDDRLELERLRGARSFGYPCNRRPPRTAAGRPRGSCRA